MTTLWANLERQYPEANKNLAAAVRTQLQERIQEEGPVNAITMGMMMALVAVVPIIACANVASLMLGSSPGAVARSGDTALARVSRMRLLRQLLIESLVLAFFGCAIGLAFAYGGIRPSTPPRPRTSWVAGRRAAADFRVDGQRACRRRERGRVRPGTSMAELEDATAAGAESAETGTDRPPPNHRPQRAGRRADRTRHGAARRHRRMVDGFRKVLVTDPGFRIDHG